MENTNNDTVVGEIKSEEDLNAIGIININQITHFAGRTARRMSNHIINEAMRNELKVIIGGKRSKSIINGIVGEMTST